MKIILFFIGYLTSHHIQIGVMRKQYKQLLQQFQNNAFNVHKNPRLTVDINKNPRLTVDIVA